MLNYIKINKKYFLLTMIIIVVGIISGIIYYYLKDIETQNIIINSLKNNHGFKYNFILKDLIYMSILFVSSFFVVGIPLGFFYLYYESFVIGFLINIFFITFNISGLLFIIIFIIFNKIVTLLMKIIFLKSNNNISRLIIGTIIYKGDNTLKSKLLYNIKKSLFLIILTLILNILLYFLSPIILNSLMFLL